DHDNILGVLHDSIIDGLSADRLELLTEHFLEIRPSAGGGNSFQSAVHGRLVLLERIQYRRGSPNEDASIPVVAARFDILARRVGFWFLAKPLNLICRWRLIRRHSAGREPLAALDVAKRFGWIRRSNAKCHDPLRRLLNQSRGELNSGLKLL